LDVAVGKANKTHRLKKRLVSFSGAAADPDSKLQANKFHKTSTTLGKRPLKGL